MVPESDTGDDFRDAYTGRIETLPRETPQIGHNPRSHLGRPNTPSVDRPFNLIPRGAEISHVKGNLETTTSTIQFGKGRNPPGVLALIAQYINEVDKTDATCLVFNEQMRVFQRILIKSWHHKDPEKAKSEMVSGKLLPGEENGKWREASNRTVTRTVASSSEDYIWDDKTRHRLKKLVQEIFAEHDKVPHIGPDGAIFIDPGPGVPDMSWNDIARLCQERFKRMKMSCNKRWETSDTDETIYCEIMYQYCTTAPKYREFLGLPLAAYVGHALRFSVAHRHHGFQMLTGWSSPPSSLSDRDDDLNNILIETWFSNAAKWDYDEVHYPAIREIIKSIQMPEKYWNPTALQKARSMPISLMQSRTH